MHKKVNRPDKTNLFLWLAWSIKELSCDSQTKHGCVITDTRNRILGTGYNSPPRNVINEHYPNTRPDKYPYFLHSEINAIHNCQILPINHIYGGVAYVTGYCCYNCTQNLWQAGVTKIYEIERSSVMLSEEDTQNKNKLIAESQHADKPLEIITIKPDFSFAQDLLSQANHFGLIHNEMEKMGSLMI